MVSTYCCALSVTSTLAASPSAMPICDGERHVHESGLSTSGGVSLTAFDVTKRQLASFLLPPRPKKPWPSSVTTVPPEKTPASGSTEKTDGGL